MGKNLKLLGSLPPFLKGATLELEIWYYDPGFFAKNDFVDPFSLYLSLKTIKDERVESALEKTMEEIKWSLF